MSNNTGRDSLKDIKPENIFLLHNVKKSIKYPSMVKEGRQNKTKQKLKSYWS